MFTLKVDRFKRKAFREAYVESHITQGLAYQIKALRTQRGWSQKDLSDKLGLKNQSAIARLEDPSYGKLSITTLLKLSNIFDVALSIRFQSFEKFLHEREDLSEKALQVLPYEEECRFYETQSKKDDNKLKSNFWYIASKNQPQVIQAHNDWLKLNEAQNETVSAAA